MMNLNIDSNKSVITFTTTKAGKADLKKDGGVVRGRHTVEVSLNLNANHRELAERDVIRLENVDMSQLKGALEAKGLVFTELDLELALNGDQPRKKGLLTALRESAQGENTNNKHLEAYSSHPCGVKGVYVHDDTGDVHIKGLIVSERIVQLDPNGEARKVNSGIHVQLKNAISKELDLETRKWRQYKLPATLTITTNVA